MIESLFNKVFNKVKKLRSRGDVDLLDRDKEKSLSYLIQDPLCP